MNIGRLRPRRNRPLGERLGRWHWRRGGPASANLTKSGEILTCRHVRRVKVERAFERLAGSIDIPSNSMQSAYEIVGLGVPRPQFERCAACSDASARFPVTKRTLARTKQRAPRLRGNSATEGR